MAGAGHIDEMNKQVRIFKLFESRFKSGEKVPGEVPDKPDRVCYYDLSITGEPQPPACGIERGKHLVLNNSGTSGQRVQQRRFTGVGVSYYRNNGDPVPNPSLFALPPCLAEYFQFLFKSCYPVTYAPPVEFKLHFSRSPAAYASHQPGHGCPFARQPGQHVFELCKLYLSFTVATVRPSCKYVKNKLRPVYDLQFRSIGYRPYL